MASYHYLSEPTYKVMDNIETYIIPENRRALEYVWSKNIMTQQTNNYDNVDSWINIGMLSPENSEIFYRIANATMLTPSDQPKIGLVGNGRGFYVPIVPGTMDTFEAFKPLIDVFQMQDVQKDGYMTIEDFYFQYTDCYSYIPNPDYHPLLEPKHIEGEDPKEFSRRFEEYVESVLTPSKLKVVDPLKMTKSLEEYLEDCNLLDYYDREEEKIFYNKRLYDGHMRYKEMVSKGHGKSI